MSAPTVCAMGVARSWEMERQLGEIIIKPAEALGFTVLLEGFRDLPEFIIGIRRDDVLFEMSEGDPDNVPLKGRWSIGIADPNRGLTTIWALGNAQSVWVDPEVAQKMEHLTTEDLKFLNDSQAVCSRILDYWTLDDKGRSFTEFVEWTKDHLKYPKII